MKFRYFYILIVLLFCVDISAQNSWSFKYGINFTKFRNAPSDYILGTNFKIAKDWYIHKNIYLNFGFHYNTQGGKLNNVLVTYKKIEYEYVHRWDILCLRPYFEFPIQIKYAIIKNKLQVNLIAGPSYQISTRDRSYRTDKVVIYDEYYHPELKEKYSNYNFKYFDAQDSYLPLAYSGFAANVGIEFRYYFLSCEIGYSYSFHSIGSVSSLVPLNYKTNSIRFLFGFYL
jgi:hypothetical protein